MYMYVYIYICIYVCIYVCVEYIYKKTSSNPTTNRKLSVAAPEVHRLPWHRRRAAQEAQPDLEEVSFKGGFRVWGLEFRI